MIRMAKLTCLTNLVSQLAYAKRPMRCMLEGIPPSLLFELTSRKLGRTNSPHPDCIWQTFVSSNWIYEAHRPISIVLTISKLRIIPIVHYCHQEFNRKAFEVSKKRENNELAGNYLKVRHRTLSWLRSRAENELHERLVWFIIK